MRLSELIKSLNDSEFPGEDPEVIVGISEGTAIILEVGEVTTGAYHGTRSVVIYAES